MSTVAERDELRRRLLGALYAQYEVDPDQPLDYQEWGSAHGYEYGDLGVAAEWLSDRGLAEFPYMGSVLKISSDGLDQVEEERRSPTVHVDLGLVLSLQERRTVEVFLGHVQRVLDDGALSGDAEEEVRAQADTIAAQTRSPEPRKGIVECAVKVILAVLNAAITGSIGNAAYAGILTAARALGFG